MVTVWRGKQGEGIEEVLREDGLTLASTDSLGFLALYDGYRIDNVRVMTRETRDNLVNEHFDSGLGSWTAASGTWGVSSGALTHTVDSTNWVIADNANTAADGTYTLRYRCDDTSDSENRANVYVRFVDESNKVKVLLKPGSVQVQTSSGGTTQTFSSVAVTTTQGAWYELKLVFEGARLEVWSAAVGSELSRIFVTTALNWTSAGDKLRIGIRPGAQWSFDDTALVSGPLRDSFSDDFSDGNYNANPGWSAGSNWSAAGGDLQNTVLSSAWNSVWTGPGKPDGVLRFTYTLESGSTATTPELLARVRKGVSDDLRVRFSTERLLVHQKVDGVYTNFVNNSSAASTLDQAYDVAVVADGSHMEVWWAEHGDTLALIGETDSITLLEATDLLFTAGANTFVTLDDISWTADDASVTDYAYDTANQLTATTENGVDTFYSYDAWGRTLSKWQGDGTAVHAEYTWFFGDRLKQYNSTFPEEAGLVQYNYDGLGKRRNKYVDSTTLTWYRWPGGTLWRITRATGRGPWARGRRATCRGWRRRRVRTRPRRRISITRRTTWGASAASPGRTRRSSRAMPTRPTARRRTQRACPWSLATRATAGSRKRTITSHPSATTPLPTRAG